VRRNEQEVCDLELNVFKTVKTDKEDGMVEEKAILKSDDEDVGTRYKLIIIGEGVASEFRPGMPFAMELSPLQTKLSEHPGENET